MMDHKTVEVTTNSTSSSSPTFRSQQKEMNVNGDRISSLPDSLIHHIFSFMDIKHAVQTSVLATRWRYVCRSLHFLNFDSEIFYKSINSSVENKEVHFLKFVEQVLLLHDKACIQRFSLHHADCPDIFPERFYLWMLAIAKHNLQELNLTLQCQNQLELPHCLFSSKSLISLKLVIKRTEGRNQFELPASISLPKLKTLHLQSLQFVNERLTNKLFSSCPCLESLTLYDCDLHLLKTLVICAPELENLEITIMASDEQYLSVDDCKIELHVPFLASFRFWDGGNIIRDCHIESKALAGVIMEIYIPQYYGSGRAIQRFASQKSEYDRRITKLLGGIRNVKVACLGESLLKFLSERPAVINSLQFSKLKYLHLGTWVSRNIVHGIVNLLKISPNVESLWLDISEENKSGSGSTGNYSGMSFLSEFTLHHLKFVHIDNVQGFVNEFILIEFFLRNAVVLEKMKIQSSNSPSGTLACYKEMILSARPTSSTLELKWRSESTPDNSV